MLLALIDYGSGNLRSAAKAFERVAEEFGLDLEVRVTADPAVVAAADRIVLPGVGAFADCMAGLRAIPVMVEAMETAVLSRHKPFLGICVGLQLLARVGREHGDHPGLGWIEGAVVPLQPRDPSLKVPHMGWNDLQFEPPGHPLLSGIQPGAHAYFVHSYHMLPDDPSLVLAHVDHGGPVVAAVAKGNIAGVQFHPEKSQEVGLILIANFLGWEPEP